MKITVSFLSAPNAAKAAGGKSVTFDVTGRTISDLIGELCDRHGEPLRRYLLDDSGRLDLSFRVVLGTGEWLTRDQLDRPLNDGDQVTIAMLVGGG